MAIMRLSVESQNERELKMELNLTQTETNGDKPALLLSEYGEN